MFKNALASKWQNLTIQVMLFTLLSTGSYFISNYISHLNDTSVVLDLLAGVILLLGGLGCVWVSIVMDNKHFKINNNKNGEQ